jgi:hypothetical protein
MPEAVLAAVPIRGIRVDDLLLTNTIEERTLIERFIVSAGQQARRLLVSGFSGSLMTKIDPVDVENLKKDREAHLKQFRTLENFWKGPSLFGNDPSVIGVLTAVAVRVWNTHHLVVCPKHFIGATYPQGDSHLGEVVFDVSADEFTRHLIPWKCVIKADAPWVMLSHVTVPRIPHNTPLSVSKEAFTYVRNMGFRGLIVADDFAGMGAIRSYYSRMTHRKLGRPESAAMAYCDFISTGGHLSIFTDTPVDERFLQSLHAHLERIRSDDRGRFASRLEHALFIVLKEKIRCFGVRWLAGAGGGNNRDDVDAMVRTYVARLSLDEKVAHTTMFHLFNWSPLGPVPAANGGLIADEDGLMDRIRREGLLAGKVPLFVLTHRALVGTSFTDSSLSAEFAEKYAEVLKKANRQQHLRAPGNPSEHSATGSYNEERVGGFSDTLPAVLSAAATGARRAPFSRTGRSGGRVCSTITGGGCR